MFGLLVYIFHFPSRPILALVPPFALIFIFFIDTIDRLNVVGSFPPVQALRGHCVVESKPEGNKPDLRISQPWPELLEYCCSADLEKQVPDVSPLCETSALLRHACARPCVFVCVLYCCDNTSTFACFVRVFACLCVFLYTVWTSIDSAYEVVCFSHVFCACMPVHVVELDACFWHIFFVLRAL